MSQEALKLALEALLLSDTVFYPQTKIAIAVIEEALAKQEQGEPVAWMSEDECEVYTSKQVDGYFQHDHIPLYTTPQQRKPLTDKQIDKAIRDGADILLDHIYEYGTVAEGVTERLRAVARAAINAAENTKGD